MRARPTRRDLLAAPAAIALVGLVFFFFGPTEKGDAGASEKLVATSICEAHELQARKALDPSLEIEIPAEYQQIWPTAAACASYAGASDPEAPGPLQPIPFSHKHHAGTYQIDCQYCHANTSESPAAGVPSVQVCMGCHSQFPPGYDEFEGVRVLKQHWKEQSPIQWDRIYRLPEYVKFRHNPHMRAGFKCQTCHGPVEEMDKLHMNQQTKWWPWLLPTKEPEMGWCIDCHRQNKAPQDCLTCHY